MAENERVRLITIKRIPYFCELPNNGEKPTQYEL